MRGKSLRTWCEENNKLDLLADWDYDCNGNLTPDNVTKSSNKKVFWRCKNGHRWTATIYNRAILANNCPYCYGRYAISGVNDLMTLAPELATEWHPYKNKDLSPSEIKPKSNKLVWWKCKKGHEWQATVVNRYLKKTNCPHCSKQLRTSFPEQAIVYYVRKYFSDVVNGFLIDGFEMDIYIPSKKVAIEYDGVAWHNNRKRYKHDILKNNYCYLNDIKLVRIREKGLPMTQKCIEIYRNDNSSDSSLNIAITCLLFSLGVVDNNIDVERDRQKILSMYVTRTSMRSLITNHSEIINEWHPTKNGKLKPEMLTAGSGQKVWWKCSKCGYEWQTSINHRRLGTGCPICGHNKTAEKHQKKVLNIDTGIVFSSLNAAASSCGLKSGSQISVVCSGKRQTAGGYHWRYVD